jgi:ArsR family transcriptional regulator
MIASTNIFAKTTISLANIFVKAYKKDMAVKTSPFNLARFFQALADNTRLRLLNMMGDQEICVCYFVEVLGQGQPKISRHLAYLRRAGVVEARREGKWMHYRIVMPGNAGAAQLLRQTLAWLKEDRTMQADRARLARACCAPAKFVALQSAPVPIPVAEKIAIEAK